MSSFCVKKGERKMDGEARQQAVHLMQFLREQGCDDPEGWVQAEIEEGRAAVTKWLFLQQLWPGIIDGSVSNPSWIYRFIDQSKAAPASAFADAGRSMERIVAAGISAEDIGRVMRFAAYESVFGVLSFIDERYAQNIKGEVAMARGWALIEINGEGVLTGRSLDGLHESLLSMDPSGREGRPERSQ
jgi:hypothetical protein